MSDHDLPEQVLAAARDDSTAFCPPHTPPFSALRARKRSRDLRRGGGAVVLSAVAVLGVALGPAALGLDDEGDGPGPAQVAGGDSAEYRLGVDWRADPGAYNDQVEQALQSRCFVEPGVGTLSTETSLPPAHTLVVVGYPRAVAMRDCIEQVASGATVRLSAAESAGESDRYLYSLTAPGDSSGEATAALDACLDGPGVLRGLLLTSSKPALNGQVIGTQNAEGLEDCARQVPGASVDIQPAAALAEIGVGQAFTISYHRLDGYDGAADDEGMRACLGLPGISSPVDPFFTRPPRYTVSVDEAARAEAFRACLSRLPNLTVLETSAGIPPAPPALSAAQQAFVRECVGPEDAEPANQYLGLSEREGPPAWAVEPEPARVVGRDGKCLGRTDDRRPERVNLIFDDGKVIWAGRF